MIELVAKFVAWIKDIISFLFGLPSLVTRFLSSASSFFGIFGSVGSVLFGLVVLCAVIILVKFIVHLVVDLL